MSSPRRWGIRTVRRRAGDRRALPGKGPAALPGAHPPSGVVFRALAENPEDTRARRVSTTVVPAPRLAARAHPATPGAGVFPPLRRPCSGTTSVCSGAVPECSGTAPEPSGAGHECSKMVPERSGPTAECSGATPERSEMPAACSEPGDACSGVIFECSGTVFEHSEMTSEHS